MQKEQATVQNMWIQRCQEHASPKETLFAAGCSSFSLRLWGLMNAHVPRCTLHCICLNRSINTFRSIWFGQCWLTIGGCPKQVPIRLVGTPSRQGGKETCGREEKGRAGEAGNADSGRHRAHCLACVWHCEERLPRKGTGATRQHWVGPQAMLEALHHSPRWEHFLLAISCPRPRPAPPWSRLLSLFPHKHQDHVSFLCESPEISRALGVKS